MHITIYRAGRCIHIGRPGSVPPSWTTFGGDWEARSFIQQHFRDSYEISRLRGALAADIHGLVRWSDREVVAEAARRLATGAWRAAYEERRLHHAVAGANPESPAAGRRTAAPRAAASAPRPATVRTERPAPRAPAKAPAPAAPTPPPEWPQSAADQAVQAQALEDAARDGTPFCAVCEAMRQTA